MTAFEIGTKLVALCQKGKNMEAIESLYSPEIVSVEAIAPKGESPELRGLEAIKGKSKWWGENHEVHSTIITGPFPNGDRFTVFFKYDITPKHTGKRMTMEEVGLYYVNKGKIVKEEFFYKGM